MKLFISTDVSMTELMPKIRFSTLIYSAQHSMCSISRVLLVCSHIIIIIIYTRRVYSRALLRRGFALQCFHNACHKLFGKLHRQVFGGSPKLYNCNYMPAQLWIGIASQRHQNTCMCACGLVGLKLLYQHCTVYIHGTCHT